MPSLERVKIEGLFTDVKEKESEYEAPSLNLLVSNEAAEKVRRKRVLISSDFRTAYKVKHVLEVYAELNQNRWCTERVKHLRFRRAIADAVADL